LVLSEQSARIFLNWIAEQIRGRARADLGATFPANLYATGFGGEVELKNLAKPIHFSVFIVASTEKEPVLEFSVLVQSLSEKMLKNISSLSFKQKKTVRKCFPQGFISPADFLGN